MIIYTPILITIPVAFPSTIKVLKKTIFLVCNGSVLVNSGDLDCGSDSPVSDELSTCNLSDSIIRISAGTLSPDFNSTISPTTIFSTSNFLITPSRTTDAFLGAKALNDFIIVLHFSS